MTTPAAAASVALSSVVPSSLDVFLIASRGRTIVSSFREKLEKGNGRMGLSIAIIRSWTRLVFVTFNKREFNPLRLEKRVLCGNSNDLCVRSRYFLLIRVLICK